MKLTKKILSLLLSVLIFTSCFVAGTVVSNAAQGDTVYLKNSADWETPYCYMWNKALNGGDMQWPGQQMTKVEGNIYSFTVPREDYDMIIFNSGSSDGKTDDLNYPGSNYMYDNSTERWYVYNPDGANLTTTLNGSYSKSHTVYDSPFTVTYNLTAPEMIAFCEGKVTYDETKLELIKMDFPKVGENLITNIKTGQFNFTGVDGDTAKGIYDFRDGNVLVKLTFSVLDASGTSNVDLSIGMLGSRNTDYIDKGVVTEAGASVIPSLSNPSVDYEQPTNPSDTVYLKNSAGWKTPYCYMWSSAQNGGDMQWPGQPMTKVEGNIYSFTVPRADYDMIIFNPGSNEGKTDDLNYPGNNYMYDNSTGKWSFYDTSTSAPTESSTPYPSGANLTTTFNGSYSKSHTIYDSQFTVTYYLTAPEMIAFCEGKVTYDESKFTLIGMDFPKVGENLVANIETGQFNFTGVDGDTAKGIYDFRDGGVFVNLTFNVLDSSGTSNIDLSIDMLGSRNTDYIDKGVVTEAGASVIPSLSNSSVEGEEPDASDTTAPTESTPANSDDTTNPEQKPTESETSEVTEPTESDSSEVTEPTESDFSEVTEPTESDSSEVTEPAESDTPGVTEPAESDTSAVTEPTESDNPTVTEPTESESSVVTEPTEPDVTNPDSTDPDVTEPDVTSPLEPETTEPTTGSDEPSSPTEPTETDAPSTDTTEETQDSTSADTSAPVTEPFESTAPTTEPETAEPTTQPATTTEPVTESAESTAPTTEPETEEPTTEPTTEPVTEEPTTEPSTPADTAPTPTTPAPSTPKPTNPPSSKPNATQPVKPATDLGKGASGAAVQAAILAMKNDSDPKGSTFNLLQVKNTKTTKNSIKLSYKKPSGTKTFAIYAAKCGTDYKMIKTIKAKTFTYKGLKKNTYYKFLVVALDKNGKVVATSKTIHVATKGGKNGNPSKVKITNASKAKNLKNGKSITLKTKVTAPKSVKVKNHRKVKFESSNTKILKVTNKGKVTAKKKGTATIYAYAQNGVMAKIKIKVS